MHAQANTSADVADEVASILEATRARGLQAAGHSGMSWDTASRIAGGFSDSLRELFRGEVRLLLQDLKAPRRCYPAAGMD